MINFDKILGGLVESISGTELVGPFDKADSTETELRFLRSNLLPSLSSMGIDLELHSRADIDNLVRMMMMRFGL